MSGGPWTRRDAIRALAAAAAAGPLLSQAGCYWEPRLQWERASEWVNVFDALEPGLDPGVLPEGAADSIASVLDRITLVPRRFGDAEHLDDTTTLFGQTFPHPILVGPDARYTGTSHEATVWRGARVAGAVTLLSAATNLSPEALREAGPAPWLLADPAWPGTRTLERAVALRASAIVLPVQSGTAAPSFTRLGPLAGASSLPVLASGVSDGKVARESIASGARGLVLTGAPWPGNPGPAESGAPILFLEEVVDAVGPGVPVLISNRFARGTDILKALALGASAVLVDRPVVWGLTAAGAPGVRRVLEILQHELAYALGMAGVPNPAGATRSLVRIHSR